MTKSPYFEFVQDFCPYAQADLTKAMRALHCVANISLEVLSNRLLSLIKKAVESAEYESLEKVNVLRVALDYIERSGFLKGIRTDLKRHYKEISYFGFGVIDEGLENKALFWIDEALDKALRQDEQKFKLLSPASHFLLKNAVKM